MRRTLVPWLLLAVLLSAGSAEARNTVGADVGYVSPLGKTGDFATDGIAIEVRFRHKNRGRTAYEFEFGYLETGLEGSIQNQIATFESITREKNRLAQLQGGPGEGSLVAEYGTLEIYYLGANLLVDVWKSNRFSPFISFGGGAYNWRVPFRVKFYNTPFFGEQHSWDPAAEGGFYAGTVGEETVDFTKQATAGGVNAGAGFLLRLTSRMELGATVRTHYIFSSGTGDREEGIDDQDYLDDIQLLLLKGGLTYRF